MIRGFAIRKKLRLQKGKSRNFGIKLIKSSAIFFTSWDIFYSCVKTELVLFAFQKPLSNIQFALEATKNEERIYYFCVRQKDKFFNRSE